MQDLRLPTELKQIYLYKAYRKVKEKLPQIGNSRDKSPHIGIQDFGKGGNGVVVDKHRGDPGGAKASKSVFLWR